MTKKKTHSQRIKEGMARKRQEEEASKQSVNMASSGLDQAIGVQAGTYDQGYEKGFRRGVNQAMSRIFYALAEVVRDGY